MEERWYTIVIKGVIPPVLVTSTSYVLNKTNKVYLSLAHSVRFQSVMKGRQSGRHLCQRLLSSQWIMKQKAQPSP